MRITVSSEINRKKSKVTAVLPLLKPRNWNKMCKNLGKQNVEGMNLCTLIYKPWYYQMICHYAEGIEKNSNGYHATTTYSSVSGNQQLVAAQQTSPCTPLQGAATWQI